MAENRRDVVKKEVRSLLLSNKDGITLQNFLKFHKELLGVPLPTREFGFTKDIEFLTSIPDVVDITIDRDGRYHLRVVADDSTKHIEKLVQKQRKITPKSKAKVKRPTYIDFSRGDPFIPALLRSQLIQLLKEYKDGLTYFGLIKAFNRTFHKSLPMDWISHDPKSMLKKIASAVPQISVKIQSGQEMIFCNKPKEFPDQYHKTQHLNAGAVASFHQLQPRPMQFKQTSSQLQQRPTKFKQNSNFSTEHKKEETASLINKDVANTSINLQCVKDNFDKVLKQHPKGILAGQFLILYEKIIGIPFNLHDYGYNCLLDVADSLPEIFSRKPVDGPPQDWIFIHSDIYQKELQPSIKVKENMPEKRSQSLVFSKNSKEIPDGCLFKRHLCHPIFNPSFPIASSVIPKECYVEFAPVFISAIFNPSLFYFHIQTKEAIEEVKALEDEIQLFYNSNDNKEYSIKDADICVGHICAAFSFKDKYWYRAVIESFPSIEDISVVYIDFGCIEKVKRFDLRYLLYSFSTVPAHAFKAQLSFVKPLSPSLTWSSKSQSRFYELCSGMDMNARVHAVYDDTLSVFLMDRSGDSDVSISEALISEESAEFCKDDDFKYLQFPYKSKKEKYSTNGPEYSSAYKETRIQPRQSASNGFTEYSHCSSPASSERGGTPQVSEKLCNGFHKLPTTEVVPEKFVKRVFLGDGYKIHILKLNKEAFVTGTELCDILWVNQDSDYLSFKLNSKEIEMPTVKFSKCDSNNLFLESERYSVKGFNIDNDEDSVVLYPLKCVMEILNIFGHPSLTVRKSISAEMKSFTSSDSFWNVDKENSHEEDIGSDDKLSRLCAYDLKTMSGNLAVKREIIVSKLKTCRNEDLQEELVKIECYNKKIMSRIADIELYSLLCV